MCRHLAHLGPPVVLHDLLFGAPHSLCAQSRHPRFQKSGDHNPDGWGVGWYTTGHDAPERYRTVTPIWDDTSFAARATTIRSAALLAAGRLASPGAAITEAGNAPFADGRWLFSLNGYVRDFTAGAGDELRAGLSPARRDALESDADSEVLFAMALDRIDTGESPAAALAGVVHTVRGLSTGRGGRLNLLLTDGDRVVATRDGSSLFTRHTTIASEPLDDDPAWTEVEEGTVLVVTHDGVTEEKL